MWRHAENSSSEKPATIDRTSSSRVVYVRKDFVEIPAAERDGQTYPAHWGYSEQAIPVEDWEAYNEIIANAQGLSDVQDALLELAGIIAGGE